MKYVRERILSHTFRIRPMCNTVNIFLAMKVTRNLDFQKFSIVKYCDFFPNFKHLIFYWGIAG